GRENDREDTPHLGYDRQHEQVGDEEDECLPEVRPQEGKSAGEAARDQAPKQELLGEPSLDHPIEERHQNSRSAEPEANERLVGRSLPDERVQRGRPEDEDGDTGARERGAVGEIPPGAELKSGPAQNLPERSLVAPLLVEEVSEERKAGENQETPQGRQGGARKQHCFAPLPARTQVVRLAPRLQRFPISA